MNEDGLAKIIKNRQQHAFADIVKMAALKEIDNTIKELTRLSNASLRARSRSNTASKMAMESMPPIIEKNKPSSE